tara:strand:+ start:5673 stop:5852 length:180 start_codon:yes stop_codon:yes gene_type:complete
MSVANLGLSEIHLIPSIYRTERDCRLVPLGKLQQKKTQDDQELSHESKLSRKALGGKKA